MTEKEECCQAVWPKVWKCHIVGKQTGMARDVGKGTSGPLRTSLHDMGRFGDALRRLRGAVTQEELARLSGVPRSTISGIESDAAKEPRWETVVAIAKALHISLDAFVEGEGALDGALSATPALDRLESLEARMTRLEKLPREVERVDSRVGVVLVQLQSHLQGHGAEPPQPDAPDMPPLAG